VIPFRSSNDNDAVIMRDVDDGACQPCFAD